MTSMRVCSSALRIVRTVVLCVPVLCCGACQTKGGGGGGNGDDGLAPGDVVDGRIAYNNYCYDCHGTPGRDTGSAADLQGTSATQLASQWDDGDHGGIPEADLLEPEQTYLDLEACLAVETTGGTAEMPCGALTDAHLQEYRDAIQADHDSGISEEDALADVLQLCNLQMLEDDGALGHDCWACLSEEVENIYQ